MIIFVKNPVPGKVKTRLAATVGDKTACNIYLRLLEHTESISRASSLPRYVYYDETVTSDDLWTHPDTVKRKQSDGDLGERMHDACAEVLKEYPHAIIIGSDCGELTDDHLEQAADSLKHCDIVIGPTVDGGYYLIGLTQVMPGLFINMPWSTSAVFDQTIQQIIERSLSFKLLQRLSDVDTHDDWLRLGWNNDDK